MVTQSGSVSEYNDKGFHEHLTRQYLERKKKEETVGLLIA
jgi:hypothetical protein